MDEFGDIVMKPIIKTKFKLRRQAQQKFGFQVEEIKDKKEVIVVLSLETVSLINKVLKWILKYYKLMRLKLKILLWIK